PKVDAPPDAYGPQQVLPFTGLNSPHGVAVDSAGTVYVDDSMNKRVLKLPAGSTNPEVLLPKLAFSLAVDPSNALYVGDQLGVTKFAAGTTNPTVLPFGTPAPSPSGIAVSSTGTVYISQDDGKKVLKLTAGATSPEVLPFTDLKEPSF